MCDKVRVLWTGGWDSTFRIVELSFKDVDIYPVYVIDPDRKSKDIEIEMMKSIISALNKKPRTKAKIHDIEIIEKESIPKDEEITKAYFKIQKTTKLGGQHEWLARLAKVYPDMEMGTEAGDPSSSHILQAIRDYGELIIKGTTGCLDPQMSTKEGLLVLGGFRFPIITRTELDMVKQIHEWGYEDIMQNTWFCHTPVRGKPCGMCHPCEVKMESNMEFLLPEDAKKRYRIYAAIRRKLGHVPARIFSKIWREFLYLKEK